jgi:hypothetical protein
MLETDHLIARSAGRRRTAFCTCGDLTHTWIIILMTIKQFSQLSAHTVTSILVISTNLDMTAPRITSDRVIGTVGAYGTLLCDYTSSAYRSMHLCSFPRRAFNDPIIDSMKSSAY